MYSDKERCDFCPNHFTCHGGMNIQVHEGYWRSSVDTLDIYKCLYGPACVSSHVPTCAKGYEGPLCAICSGKVGDEYYSRSGKYECQACEDRGILIAKTVGILFLFIIYVSVLVGVIIASADRNQQNSVLFRILTNYF
jgi:hypothetical protein